MSIEIKFEDPMGIISAAMSTIVPYRSKKCSISAECSIGRELRRTLEPSRGGMGMRLKTARVRFMPMKTKKKFRYDPVSRTKREARPAKRMLLSGPAREVMISSRLGWEKL